MTRLRLDTHARVTVRREHYMHPRPTAEGYEMTSERTGETRVFAHSVLEDAVAQGALHYHPTYHAPSIVAARKRGVLPDQRAPSKTQAEMTAWRTYFYRRFLELEKEGRFSRSRDSLELALSAIYTEYIAQKQNCAAQTALKKGPAKPQSERPSNSVIVAAKRRSYRTAQRWLQAAATGGDLALIPAFSRCGNRFSRFSAEASVIMNRFARSYEDETRPTITLCHSDMADEFHCTNEQRLAQDLPELKIPSVSAFRTLLRFENQFRQYARRYGTAKAIAKFYAGRGGPNSTFPLQRCEIDECYLDLMTLLADRRIFDLLPPSERSGVVSARMWLTIIIDCATRYILAVIVSATPTSSSARRALKMAVRAKDHIAAYHGAATKWSGGGSIIELFADNGSSFIDADFRDACALLGIILTHTPAGKPQLRATIERVFRTLTLEALAPFLGRTFENVVVKGDYPAEQRAILTQDELSKVLVRAVVDVYHNTPHRGLNGETPLRAWNRLAEKYGVPPPPPRIKEIAAFGVESQRKTEIRGVVFAGLWYQNEQLQQHRMRHGDTVVPIRIDPDMLCNIAVRLDGDWVLVPATDQEEAFTSLPDRVRETSFLRARFAKQAKADRAAVRKARADFRAMRNHGALIADVVDPLWGDGEVRVAERQVLLGFTITEVDDDGEAQRLGEEIPTSGSLSDAVSVAPSNTGSSRERGNIPPRTASPLDGWELK